MRKVALYSLFIAAAASQAIMIDDFETGPFDAVLENNYVSQTGLPNGNSIGGTRAEHAFDVGGFLQMTCTAGGTGRLVLNTIGSSFSDVFWLGSLAKGTPPSGPGTLLPDDFDGLNPTIDLSSSNFFRVVYTTQSNDYQINLHVYNADLSESVSSQFMPLAAGDAVEMFVSFNVFSAEVYDNAGGFRLSIEGLDQGIIGFHEIEVVAVPEPAAIVTLALGIAGLAARRKLSRRSAD